MSNSIFSYIGNLDTLIAVIIGAVLATGGALIADVIQDRIGRKRKERDAAKFFGEILASIDFILDRTFDTMEIGERWGKVTRRYFSTALNEADIYQRNRERLFDISDMTLRMRIHSHFLSETVPITAIIEQYSDIQMLEKELKTTSLTAKHRKALNAEITTLKNARNGTLGAIKTEHAKTAALCKALEKIARVKFTAPK